MKYAASWVGVRCEHDFFQILFITFASTLATDEMGWCILAFSSNDRDDAVKYPEPRSFTLYYRHHSPPHIHTHTWSMCTSMTTCKRRRIDLWSKWIGNIRRDADYSLVAVVALCVRCAALLCTICILMGRFSLVPISSCQCAFGSRLNSFVCPRAHRRFDDWLPTPHHVRHTIINIHQWADTYFRRQRRQRRRRCRNVIWWRAIEFPFFSASSHISFRFLLYFLIRRVAHTNSVCT